MALQFFNSSTLQFFILALLFYQAVQLARTVVGRRAGAAVVAYGYLVVATLKIRRNSSNNSQQQERRYTKNGKTHDLFCFVNDKSGMAEVIPETWI